MFGSLNVIRNDWFENLLRTLLPVFRIGYFHAFIIKDHHCNFIECFQLITCYTNGCVFSIDQVVLEFVNAANLTFEDKIAGLRSSVEIYGNVHTCFPTTHERADALGHEIFM